MLFDGRWTMVFRKLKYGLVKNEGNPKAQGNVAIFVGTQVWMFCIKFRFLLKAASSFLLG